MWQKNQAATAKLHKDASALYKLWMDSGCADNEEADKAETCPQLSDIKIERLIEYILSLARTHADVTAPSD